MNIPSRKRILHLLQSGWRERRSLWRLWRAGLRPGDIAIDCGANVGEITARMRSRGATVYAFEPNPHAFAALQKRFAGDAEVHCLQNAVLDDARTVQLYFHSRAAENPLYWSQGSSLLASKSNVSKEGFLEVEAVDIASFILALPGPVKVLKIDVEGVEDRILRRLLASDAIDRVEHVFVETHEAQAPELRESMAQLRQEIRRRGLRKVDLDWV